MRRDADSRVAARDRGDAARGLVAGEAWRKESGVGLFVLLERRLLAIRLPLKGVDDYCIHHLSEPGSSTRVGSGARPPPPAYGCPTSD
ncbi:MAG: hypothetical protein RJA70_1800 [Pseudomonadota bacterium]|jgi:hypothetical protein